MPDFTLSNPPRGNSLLAALSLEDYQKLVPQLEYIHLELGKVIYQPGETLNYIYFPISAVVSLLYTLKDRTTAEVGLIGNDGVVGLAVFLGAKTTNNQAIVQIAGDALRIKVETFMLEFDQSGSFRHLMLLHTHTLITQISQTAVCNRSHSMEQRLCRWLLLSYDRINSDELRMTHQYLAYMVGGRREAISLATKRLQTAGILRSVRGHITLLDRTALEANACECYEVVRTEFERVLPQDKQPKQTIC
jgi:CRP-like cAMP-binding protein